MSEADPSALMLAADPAMVVVTTVAAGERAGCLVGFHAQASIDPPRYCVWLSKANHTYRVALRATRFAVHFLDESDLDVARHFGTRSGLEVDKFTDVDLDPDDGGVPLLRTCPNRMVLERVALLDDGGDHVCVTSRVLASQAVGHFVPLRLSGAAHLEPGRDSEERVIEP